MGEWEMRVVCVGGLFQILNGKMDIGPRGDRLPGGLFIYILAFCLLGRTHLAPSWLAGFHGVGNMRCSRSYAACRNSPSSHHHHGLMPGWYGLQTNLGRE
jgi:hypothetical protein